MLVFRLFDLIEFSKSNQLSACHSRKKPLITMQRNSTFAIRIRRMKLITARSSSTLYPVTLYSPLQTLQKMGYEYTWDLKHRVMGRGDREGTQIIIDTLGLDMTVDEYMIESDKILDELLKTAELMPGAEKLVRHLHKHKIPIALCTGAKKKHFAPKVTNHQELFSLFNHVVLASDDPDVKFGKPAPDCFQVTAGRFSPKPSGPSNVLIFEDSPNGVQAGLAAKMQVLMVPDPRVDESIKKTATLCLESLEQFFPEQFGLPPF